MKLNKLFATATLVLASMTSQAALIEVYDVGGSLTNINQAEALIGGTPTHSWNTATVNYHNNWPFGRLNTFVARITGTLDTDLFNNLNIRHDDGFRLRLGGVVVAEYVGLTAPRNTSFNVAAAGIQNLELTYFENRGTETLRVRTNSFDLVNIGDPAGVPEPASMALIGLGAGLLGLRRRRNAS